ncbi:MAG: alpha/beta fold hydrolase [Desulfuromonadales bacterium]
MFENFIRKKIVCNEIEINLVLGGKGPPLLLLHGYPQTHVMWRLVAPRLARSFTVVATDLRGYGDSSKPAGLPDHSNYSKRAMAGDQVGVMRQLGFDSFFLCGHDRGGRVAHRLATDYPELVEKLVVLDIAPTKAMYEKTTMTFARAYYHWFFLIQAAPYPETLISGAPEAFLHHHMTRFAGLEPFMPDAWPEYLRHFSDPKTIHATCEDYRAAATVDMDHAAADLQEGRKIICPLLALWGSHGIVERCFNPIEEWEKVGTTVSGKALPCGHYIPEEVPELLVDELVDFLGN